MNTKTKTLYTDRDYLDEKFKEINDRLDSVIADQKSTKIILMGEKEDGSGGLVKKVEGNEHKIEELTGRAVYWMWYIWFTGVFIFITHAHEAVEFITDFFKKRL